jgi:hypothetical protein
MKKVMIETHKNTHNEIEEDHTTRKEERITQLVEKPKDKKKSTNINIQRPIAAIKTKARHKTNKSAAIRSGAW